MVSRDVIMVSHGALQGRSWSGV